MQQQQIQERIASFALLGKAEVLCNTWRRLQSKSLSILQSIGNIVAQRAATFEQPSTLEQHGVDMARLVYKQTESLESLIRDLGSVIDLFEKVTRDWSQLDLEAARHALKSAARLSAAAETKPVPLSTNSLIQVTSPTAFQVQNMVSRLAYMYKEEFGYKLALFSTLQSNASSQEQMQLLTDHWDAQTHIDTALQEEVCERTKLYKTVKRVLESVD
ncbi:hypothetical protein [Parasitella parasitica]|uniref:Uncharacterized protein n=1 Tax=Parasitella parasitica TaxID=35722 RepID=A0A0B7NLA4_9FUNG|nr:hypothetical protein [Parasitella parasitica]